MVVNKFDNDINTKIINSLKLGNVIVLPCDTVYGLSSIYLKGDKKLKELKGRDANKPFLVLATKQQAKELCSDIPESIMNTWPAPLTVILPIEGNKTLGIRVPKDDFLLNLLNQLGSPIYSTSVNMSGEPYIKDFNEIVEKFDDKVDLIVKDKEVSTSLPSTLIDATVKPFKLIRQGSFDVSELLEKS